ncbi:hypothetical protein J2W15_000881 [Pseudarthrobacter sulfonivorans]|nr:hypothetical protein [Pseudarthrobacter sulfonivorans]
MALRQPSSSLSQCRAGAEDWAWYPSVTEAAAAFDAFFRFFSTSTRIFLRTLVYWDRQNMRVASQMRVEIPRRRRCVVCRAPGQGRQNASPAGRRRTQSLPVAGTPVWGTLGLARAVVRVFYPYH